MARPSYSSAAWPSRILQSLSLHQDDMGLSHFLRGEDPVVACMIFQDSDFFQTLCGGGEVFCFLGLVEGDFEEELAVLVEACGGFSEDSAVEDEAVEAAV